MLHGSILDKGETMNYCKKISKMLVMVIILMTLLPEYSAAPFKLPFKKVVAFSEIENHWKILELLKTEFPDTKIISYYAEGEVVFCLYKIRYDDSDFYLALVSPQSQEKVSLLIDKKDRTTDLGLFTVRTFGQIIDGENVIVNQNIEHTNNIGLVFSVSKSDSCEFLIKIKHREGLKYWIANKNSGEDWNICISSGRAE